jgi:hypothetical protein
MNFFASLFLAMAVYTTNFPLTENPISEGGKWLQNNTNRAKVLTDASHHAFGTGTNNDGYAYLSGFGDSVIESTIWRSASLADNEANSYEFEHHHRLTDDAGTTASYELDCAYSGGFNIVRWSGATSFAVLSGLVTDANFFPDGAGGQWRTGYRLKTECVLLPTPRINIYADSGGGYTLFFHYILGADTTNDNPPLASGDPGIAFFTTLGGNNWLGFSSTTITSPAAGLGINLGNYPHPGRSPGKGGISSARFQTNWWPYSPPAVVAFDPALMSAMEKHGNDPVILPPQVVASGMTPPEEMPT